MAAINCHSGGGVGEACWCRTICKIADVLLFTGFHWCNEQACCYLHACYTLHVGHQVPAGPGVPADSLKSGERERESHALPIRLEGPIEMLFFHGYDNIKIIISKICKQQHNPKWVSFIYISKANIALTTVLLISVQSNYHKPCSLRCSTNTSVHSSVF